ncbi:MFS transporter [Streptosporangium carneum]|uniref:MFS transporter n=1 Tax=Streptosporangium carneum TaxID=47481 RepID=A0A9W6HZP5_9ACTN|nr:MFS transporter [Streptosporangium carneum]
MTPAGGTEGAPVRPLWRERDFVVFWGAQTFSVAGDSFAYVAVPLLVLHVTGSVAQMGLLTGVAGVASIVAGLFAGALVDRFDRRALLIYCDLARVVSYGLIPLAWTFGPQVWLLYVVLPVSEAIGMVFQVTYVTAVRTLVRDDRVTEANGLLYATYAAAGIAGPLLAGLVTERFGATAAVAVNAASFAVSVVGIRLIRFGGQATAPDGQAVPARQGPWRELLAGVRFLWRHPVLRPLTVLLSFLVFLTYGLTDVLIYFFKHDLGRSDGEVGVILAIAGLGTIAGSLLAAPVRRRLWFGASWIGAQAVGALAMAGIGLSGDIPVITALAAAYLACASVAGISSMSLRQQVTPDRLLGRVTSAFWTIHNSTGPVGAALLTWMAGRYGAAEVFLLAGGGCLLIAVAALLTPVRRAAPEQPEHTV